MAARRISHSHSIASYRGVPELEAFFVGDVERIGKRLGPEESAIGIVDEVTINGEVYVGKRFNPALLDIGVPRLTERFIFACNHLSKISHPNIVRFIGLCTFERLGSGHPVLVMEKVDFDLETLLETQTDLSFPLILRLLQDIANGVTHIHSQTPPIIHCDLTARNVLINNATMNAKVTDLGNSLVVDPTKLFGALRQVPGTLPYLPPEVKNDPSLKPDTSLDMFSFGHLSLYAVIHECPRDLLLASEINPRTEEMIARNEVQRREKYINKLIDILSSDHPVTKTIQQCLSNIPEKRPKATKVLQQFVTLYKEEGENYIDIVDFTNKARIQTSLMNPTSNLQRGDIMNHHRIEKFRDGSPAILEILRPHSTSMFTKKQLTWKKQLFKIEGGYLKYFKNIAMEKPHDQLPLSSVVCVKACPHGENESVFDFEVHFNKHKGSPWTLRAYTQDERTCWMEAIQPNSTSNYYERPLVSVDEYEDIEYIRTHSNEAYTSHQRPQSPGPVYDEPDTTTKRPLSPGAPQKNQGFPPGDLASYYDEPAEITSKPLTQTKTSLSPMHNIMMMSHTFKSTVEKTQENLDSSDNDCYVDLFKSESDGHSDTIPPLQVQKSQSIPKKLETLSEISLENLSNLNSNDIQLWMLIQMQKVVQDTAEVTRNLGRSRIDSFEQPQASGLPPPPPFPPPLEEIEEIYDEDEGDDYYNQSSADVLSKSRPQSCRVKMSYPEERFTTGGVGYQEPRHRSNTTMIATGNVAPQSHWKSTHQHTVSSVHLPPLKPKPDTLATKKVRSMIPATIRQKREATHEEMISTLKRRNKSLSPSIASLLAVNSDGTTHDSAKKTRPEWTKAKTQSPKIEVSLAELEQKALFIPVSALSEKLEEIGKGNFGKVFKGVHKGSRLPVAIKTLKQYESEKEKESFQREMAVMKKLMHPNIVRLFGLVQQDPPLIVLEYLPHGDLRTFLRMNERPVERLVKYMLDIATGMHYISEMGLVHRDLAARNVMVSKEEVCKVGDFGLLRELPKDIDIYVATTKVPFPIRWMAPECHLRKEFSPATDVWSFAVVMWEMFNPEETPYKGLSNTQVAANVCTGKRLHIPEPYPKDVKTIMKACWQEEPSERPSFILIALVLSNIVFGSD